MKIKKIKLSENYNLYESEEDTLSTIDPNKDSISEIADALQNSVEEVSDDSITMSNNNAQKAAEEIKKAADEISADEVAVDTSLASDENILYVENELTRKLDKVLRISLSGRRQSNPKNANLLVTGLPGSGKTSIVGDWAKAKKLNFFYVDTSDPDLETAVYGLTLRDETRPNRTTKAPSDFLNKLDNENSVLFLDEFNRGADNLRRALLALVNEHAVKDSTYPNGVRKFKNLLFTVACVNPGGFSFDRNARELSDAEKSRFAIKLDFDSNVPTTKDYFTKRWDNLINNLNKNDSYYEQDLTEFLKLQDLGLFIINHRNPDFMYDTINDIDDLRSDENGKPHTMLNQRSLTDGLDASEGSISGFKDWLITESNFLQRDIDLILKILKDYKEPTLSELIAKKKAESPDINIDTTGLNISSSENITGAVQPSENKKSTDIEDNNSQFSGGSNTKTGAVQTAAAASKTLNDIGTNWA